jgi:kynurenine formamidase
MIANESKLVKEGISISLNWSLEKPAKPVFRRARLGHEIVDNSTKGSPGSFDDNVTFNTQSSSQWDGLRHVVNRDVGLFYNGFNPADLEGHDATFLSISNWHSKGGIVGRGVLIDYVAYAERHNIQYSATESHAITHLELEDAAREQHVDFRKGDILLVRSGLVKWYEECSDVATRDKFFEDPSKASVGVLPSEDAIAWVWDHHFSAVAGDALAWERVPYPRDSPSFHQYLISMWGTPIGELWDLEKLAQTCKTLGRYSFLLVSVPLNIPGGVASPPNAVAIF